MNDSLVLLSESIVSDILTNNGQKKSSNPFTSINKGSFEVTESDIEIAQRDMTVSNSDAGFGN